MSLLSTTPSSTSLFFPKTPFLHPHQPPSLSPFPNLNLRSSPPSLSLSSSRLSSSSRTFSSLNNTNDDEEQDDTKSSPLGRGSWAEKLEKGAEKLEKGAEKFEKRGENIAKGVEKTGDKIIDTLTGRGGPTKKNKKPNPTDLVERITVSDDEWGEKSQPEPVSDEWGEKSEPEPETPSKFPGADPPIREDEDEWGPDDVAGNGGVQIGSGSGRGSGSGSEAQEEMNRKEKIMELKRGLVDSVYGSNFGFGSSLEVRAEVSELVTQLEALNPTPNPIDVPALLDGNWVLVKHISHLLTGNSPENCRILDGESPDEAFKETQAGVKPPGVWKTLLGVVSPVKSAKHFQNFYNYRVLWTGLGAQLARDVPFSAICWGTLEPIRRAILSLTGDEVNAVSILGANFSAGFVSGCLAAAGTCPLDVARTRRQIEKDPARQMSMTTRQTLLVIWRDGGWKGLFTGISPRVARAGPSVGIVVSFYVVVKYALHCRHLSD